jgi:hypothetical protein
MQHITFMKSQHGLEDMIKNWTIIISKAGGKHISPEDSIFVRAPKKHVLIVYSIDMLSNARPGKQNPMYIYLTNTKSSGNKYTPEDLGIKKVWSHMDVQEIQKEIKERKIEKTIQTLNRDSFERQFVFRIILSRIVSILLVKAPDFVREDLFNINFSPYWFEELVQAHISMKDTSYHDNDGYTINALMNNIKWSTLGTYLYILLEAHVHFLMSRGLSYIQSRVRILSPSKDMEAHIFESVKTLHKMMLGREVVSVITLLKFVHNTFEQMGLDTIFLNKINHVFSALSRKQHISKHYTLHEKDETVRFKKTGEQLIGVFQRFQDLLIDTNPFIAFWTKTTREKYTYDKVEDFAIIIPQDRPLYWLFTNFIWIHSNNHLNIDVKQKENSKEDTTDLQESTTSKHEEEEDDEEDEEEEDDEEDEEDYTSVR